jgi:hypothetical protein
MRTRGPVVVGGAVRTATHGRQVVVTQGGRVGERVGTGRRRVERLLC